MVWCGDFEHMLQVSQQVHEMTRREFAFENLRPPYFESFFQIWQRFELFWNCQKNRRKYRFRFPPQMRRIQKKIVFVFLLFWRKYWPQSDQILPSFSHQHYLQLLFFTFSPNFRKYFWLFYISSFDVFFLRRRDRVVGRAVDSRNKIPGSSRAADIFFSFRICGSQKTPHLRKAELFLAKKSSAFFKNSLHKLQIR